jgi:hippurate hydrolase
LFEIHVQGVGCHGSMPNTGIDPLNVAAHILIALQELSARELAMSDQAALTIGTIHAGTAANVIADSVTMGGSLRTYNEDVRAFLKERMQAIATHTAETFRATATVTFQTGCPTLTNDADLSACIQTYVEELLGSERTISVADLNRTANGASTSKSAGSEDFAYVSQEVPSLMLALAAGEPDKGYTYPQHHPMVTFDESVLSGGSAVYAYTAMRWLKDHR